jgi:hypothetical protein
MEYYTYAYLREDGTPYYIGKGKAGRITNNLHRIVVPKEKKRIIYLKKNLTDEEARKHEIYMIAILGRKDLGTGILRNMTDGGEGCAGRRLSKETKKKLSDSHKGKKFTDEHKRKLSEAAKKKIFTKEHRHNMSKGLKGVMSKEKNPSYGKKWWNNGVDNKFSKECPGDDFSLGRVGNNIGRRKNQ